jgi:nicotinamidase-related amidase
MTLMIPRLTAAASTLVVVDVQDKLLAAMPTAASLVRTVSFLLDVATLLEVPARSAEHYPKGLGPTNADVAKRLPPNPPAKTAFSCCGAAGFLPDLKSLNRSHVVLVGMETHVCLSLTALDLLEAGFTVFVPVDAVACRFALDGEVALKRLEKAGAVLTTAEAVAFEWMVDASHPQFKAVSKLVIENGKQRP